MQKLNPIRSEVWSESVAVFSAPALEAGRLKSGLSDAHSNAASGAACDNNSGAAKGIVLALLFSLPFWIAITLILAM